MLISGLPLHHGARLAVDVALWSVVTAAASPNAARVDRAVADAWPEMSSGGCGSRDAGAGVPKLTTSCESVAWARSQDTHHVLPVVSLLGSLTSRAAICPVLTEWPLTWRTSLRWCEVVGVRESFTSNFGSSSRCDVSVVVNKKKYHPQSPGARVKLKAVGSLMSNSL